jgi:hypothetical protein
VSTTTRRLGRPEIFAERVRTIEQVKRLYAVVMGYAVTNLFNNLYACAKAINYDALGMSALVTFSIVFASLSSLFFLGSERALDMRYLRPWSKLPYAASFLFDYLTLGATASMFVILSDTMPNPSQIRTPQAVISDQYEFSIAIIIIYCVDSAFLVVNIVRMLCDRPRADRALIYAHAWWLALNFVAAVVLFHCLFLWKQKPWHIHVGIYSFGINPLTAVLLMTHAARFLLDFFTT